MDLDLTAHRAAQRFDGVASLVPVNAPEVSGPDQLRQDLGVALRPEKIEPGDAVVRPEIAGEARMRSSRDSTVTVGFSGARIIAMTFGLSTSPTPLRLHQEGLTPWSLMATPGIWTTTSS